MAGSRKNKRAAVVSTVAAAFGIAFSSTLVAYAAETDDPRATPHDGNVATCSAAGLDGTLLDKTLLDYEAGIEESDLLVTISEVLAENVTVTGIVIKGGDAYNLYVPGELGLSETPPWEDLISPINNGDNQPELSHWFVCVEPADPPSSEPPSSEPPSSEPSSSVPTTEPTEPPSSTAPPSTTVPVTTTAPPVTDDVDEKSNDSDLAVTGFGDAWVAWAGSLLLLSGIALVAGLRALRRN